MNFKLSTKVRRLVAKWLERDPKMNYNRLVKNVWYEEMITCGYKPEQAKATLEGLPLDILSSFQTIERVSRKLRAENPQRYGSPHHDKATETAKIINRPEEWARR